MLYIAEKQRFKVIQRLWAVWLCRLCSSTFNTVASRYTKISTQKAVEWRWKCNQ